jgi:hypothetical protein
MATTVALGQYYRCKRMSGQTPLEIGQFPQIY